MKPRVSNKKVLFYDVLNITFLSGLPTDQNEMTSTGTINLNNLTILARYEAKIANICNFWTFRLVIQLIKHLFKILQKAFLPNGS